MSGEGVGGLSDDDKAVIRERHFGWEQASFAALAAVFRTHPNTIAAICRQSPMAGVPQSTPATQLFDDRLRQGAEGFRSVLPFHSSEVSAS